VSAIRVMDRRHFVAITTPGLVSGPLGLTIPQSLLLRADDLIQ